MLKNGKLLLILFLALTAAVLVSGQAMAGIAGSVHDFSGKSWNTTGQTCVTCHTPHNAQAGTVPLWNHATTIATFGVYASPTLNASVGQPTGVSKACLSCHDGTVALDSFGGNTGTTFMSPGGTRLGTDLTNDHPVSFTYDTALATADKELKNPTTATSGLGGTIQNDMLLSNKLECSSCHDPHNGSGIAKFLVKSNAASALCLTCHTK